MKHQLAILAISIILAFLWTHFNYNNDESDAQRYTIKQLKHIKWPKDLNAKQTQHFLQQIANNRSAIVITDHPYFGTLKRPIWKPNDLIKYFDSLDDNERNQIEYKSNLNCPIFQYYESNLPLIDIIHWKAPNNNTKLTQSLKQYWKHISKQTQFINASDALTHKTLYLCNVSNSFEFRSFSTQLLPTDTIIQSLFPKYLSEFIGTNQRLTAIKLWMGSKGVITQFHWDVSNNFNLQIFGKKLFRILEPKYHWHLSHFPWLHPQSRKSQIIKNGLFEYTFPDSNHMFEDKFVIYETVLNEGEIIFIPSMFDHEVIGMSDEIINLNIWTQFQSESEIMNKLIRSPLPFDMIHKGLNANITQMHLMSVNLQLYIRCLLIEFCKIFALNGKYSLQCNNAGYVKYLMNTFVQSRYEPVFQSENGNLSSEKMNEMKVFCGLFEHWELRDGFVEWYEVAVMANKHKFEKYAANIVKKELMELGESVGVIFLTSYFEIMAEYLLTIHYVFPFFSYCF